MGCGLGGGMGMAPSSQTVDVAGPTTLQVVLTWDGLSLPNSGAGLVPPGLEGPSHAHPIPRAPRLPAAGAH